MGQAVCEGVAMTSSVKLWRIIRSDYGYGSSIWLGPRVRVSSGKALTPMSPRIYRGSDEYCNDTICLHLWPLGGVAVWWRWRQRTEADGMCDQCRDECKV